MSKDHIYEKRWEFRRKDSDLDSSSDEKESISARNQKLRKGSQILGLVQAEDKSQEEEVSHNPGVKPSAKRAKTRTNPVRKTREQKPKKCTKKPEGGVSKKSGYKYNLDAAIKDLEKHVNVLVKELNASREGLSKWMEDELKKLVPESHSASPSKPARKGKRQITKKTESESSKKTPSKKIHANGSNTATADRTKPIPEASNLCKTSTMSTENPSMEFLPSNYLNSLPNLNPRPLAENYLVKANCTSLSSTLRLEPVVLNSNKDPYRVQQQQSAGYYQGINLQTERDFDRSVFSTSMSNPIGSLGGFSSATHLGFRGAFNVHNMGLSGSEFLAQENTFPSLSNNHLKYSS